MALLKYISKKTPEDQGIFLPKGDNGVLPSEVVASANARVGEITSEPKQKRRTFIIIQKVYHPKTAQ